jgi:hypothetical protein
LQKYLKQILMKSNEISENCLFSYEFYKLVATVAEPTMSDKRSHFVFDSEELEDISKKLSKDYRYVCHLLGEIYMSFNL